MDPIRARKLLAAGRLGVGIAALAAPRLTARALGVAPEHRGPAVYVTRMFGAREIFMASPFLLLTPGIDEAELASRAVPVDGADALAAMMAGAKGFLPWRTALPSAAVAVAGCWLGAQAARRP